jgi:hypothetical protein
MCFTPRLFIAEVSKRPQWILTTFAAPIFRVACCKGRASLWRFGGVDRPEIVICRALPRFLSSQPCWNKKQPLSLSDVSGDWRGP